MGIFSRKNKSDFAPEKKLPELPKLPMLPTPGNEEDFKSPAPKLPKFPDGYFGEKFSQNNIKEAVTGKKEEEVFADEFDSGDEFQTMHEPQTKEIRDGFGSYDKKAVRETIVKPERKDFFPERKTERTEKSPVFIRIDRFEEGRDTLEKIKRQISEIEKILGNIKGVKEAEKRELETWEREIQAAKQQVEKINNELFSRIE